MKPVIEWRVGEDNAEETIVQVKPPAAHWRLSVLLCVVVAGLGLGLIYSSIPEPPPRPAVLPAPTRNLNLDHAPLALHPAAHLDDAYTRFELLRKTVDQEVAALADGAKADFLALQDQNDADWLESQRQGFSAWERPPSAAAPPGTLYFYGGNTFSANDGEAWFDISQYHRGSVFRETRFYRWQVNRWVRVRPPLDFWSGAPAEVVTPHFQVSLPQADQALATDVAQRLEAAYQQICTDLACPQTALTPAQLLRVQVSPELAGDQSWFEPGDPPVLRIPSPRVSGLLVTGASLDQNDPLMQLLYSRLSEILAQVVSGGSTRWRANPGGMLYLTAIAQWELQRSLRGNDLDGYIGTDLLRGRRLTLPQYLWDWPVRDGRRLASPQAQANSVIAFIDQSFGAERVVALLKTLNTARSLPQAIEATLPLSYVSFEQHWQQWLEEKLNK